MVKTRKQGNSLMITIPAEFKVEANAEYQPVMEDNGVISFIPKHDNIFAQNPEYDLRAAIKELGVSDNGDLVGREDVWQ
ncbi:AbrB family transcriptional regulator [Lactobacillus sp. ESL0684]|uniref:type II toxin-antitoxin system PemI/MazE family antitoxin n=1 Tax=Lactobacillus sp. ESL0684 TaxID=2983213 RepID=UPI0023F8692F|nr:AbrB family transcriptional regulator [Lactobacillus sp. ESL0684]WEV43823.1 AbrB family transcriptional regulator [Lactobacillus sp. ESL0684]